MLTDTQFRLQLIEIFEDEEKYMLAQDGYVPPRASVVMPAESPASPSDVSRDEKFTIIPVAMEQTPTDIATFFFELGRRFRTEDDPDERMLGFFAVFCGTGSKVNDKTGESEDDLYFLIVCGRTSDGRENTAARIYVENDAGDIVPKDAVMLSYDEAGAEMTISSAYRDTAPAFWAGYVAGGVPGLQPYLDSWAYAEFKVSQMGLHEMMGIAREDLTPTD